MQRLPIGKGLVPRRTSGREGATFHIVERVVIEGHHARACAGLNGHIADGHATFNREATNGTSSKLNGVARSTSRSDLSNHGEHDVLGGDSQGQHTIDTHLHVLCLLHEQALGGQHMLHLGGANAKGKTRQCPMGAGVRIATDHGHSRKCGALLGANHVNNSLAMVL